MSRGDFSSLPLNLKEIIIIIKDPIIKMKGIESTAETFTMIKIFTIVKNLIIVEANVLIKTI